jgi:hypothetical protein
VIVPVMEAVVPWPKESELNERTKAKLQKIRSRVFLATTLDTSPCPRYFARAFILPPNELPKSHRPMVWMSNVPSMFPSNKGREPLNESFHFHPPQG